MRIQNVRRRHQARAVAAALGTIIFGATLAVAPAQAAPPDAHQYVALGDSYAAGQGATPNSGPVCFSSKKAYPVIADRLRDVELTANAACSGYSTAQVAAAALSAVTSDTDVITITAGGIDLGTNTVLATCSIAPPPSDLCTDAINAAYASLGYGTIYTNVLTMLGTIHAAAPNAKIVITGYPLLFEPLHPFAGIANSAVEGLNLSIATAAFNAVVLFDAEVQYVDVAGAFAGHGIGSADPWINFNPANLADPANFHPNGEGYRHGYYASLVNQGAFTALD